MPRAPAPRLIDFDLVFVPSAMPLTATTGMGTRCFAAPEVLVGREDATAAADVYGLAATTLYVLTCGQLPGPTPQAPEVLLRSLPEDGALRRLLTAALRLDPRRRTGSALAYCRELRGVASSLANSTRVILVSEPGSAAPDELLGRHAFLGARDAVWTPCGRKLGVARGLDGGELRLGGGCAGRIAVFMTISAAPFIEVAVAYRNAAGPLELRAL